ncbi:MAG: DUF3494 domain-containing protein [Actinobacteria bacterium]|nr:DUF3494 domain-containing protein [Actinomycetota bacterium]
MAGFLVLTRSSSADLCGFSWLLTAPCSRPYTSSIVRRVDSLSGAGIHHIEEKGNSYPFLSKAGISTTGATKIVGDIGVSPIAATAITGFGLVMASSSTFSKSTLVTGKVYAADYKAPTPSILTTAVSNMQTAYTNAAGRAPTSAATINVGAGSIGGLTLVPGVYKWTTGVTIPTNVTLSGGKNDIWIFQVAGTLNISSGQKIILKGGAQSINIFWQVAGATTLGTNSVFNGNILDKTNIAVQTGAVLNGRALAQTAVTLDANTIQNK